MKTKKQLREEIKDALEIIISRYEEKESLLAAEETHGEELDEDFIMDKVQQLRDLRDNLNDELDDLSYIE